jgi:Cys-rich protein (TIGR01571 family)
VSCFGTSVAQLEVIQALGFSPSFCQSFSMLFTVGSLWLAVGATLMFGLYPFAAAAFAMILLLESYVAFRLRTVVRRRYNIEGNACQDCLLSTMATSCVTAQILRHLK